MIRNFCLLFSCLAVASLDVVSLAVVSLAVAESIEPEDKKHEVQRWSAAEIDTFLQAVLSGTPLTADNLSLESDSDLAFFWEGNIPKCETGLKEVVLNFRNSEDENEQFAVTVLFNNRDLIFRNSQAAGTQYAGGVRVAKDRPEGSRFLLLGANHRSVAVFSATGVNTDEAGFLICPRSYVSSQVRHGKRSLSETEYHLTHINPRFAAFAQGKVLTGRYEGIARAEINTAKGLTIADPSSIEKMERNAEVIFQYSSMQDEKGNTLNKLVYEDDFLDTGIEASLELVLPGGQSRTNRCSASLSLVDTKVDEPVTLRVQNTEMLLGAGRCYLLRSSSAETVSYAQREPVRAEE